MSVLCRRFRPICIVMIKKLKTKIRKCTKTLKLLFQKIKTALRVFFSCSTKQREIFESQGSINVLDKG